MIDLYKGDCLEVMDELIAKGVVVDAIITDPPYQTTACAWDFVVPFNNHIMIQKGKKEVPMYKDEWVMRELRQTYKSIHQCEEEFDELSKEGMWQKLNKLIKPNGAIVLFGSEPFSSALRMSNIKNYKYDWVWDKVTAKGHLVAKIRPMQQSEVISVFGRGKIVYNPIMTDREAPRKDVDTEYSRTELVGGKTTKKQLKIIRTKRYPKTILTFSNASQKNKLHPTQKPVELMEYLIKTYTNEGELVLDFTMGSGSTGVACKNLGRDFIGIEMDNNYFNIAKERING